MGISAPILFVKQGPISKVYGLSKIKRMGLVQYAMITVDAEINSHHCDEGNLPSKRWHSLTIAGKDDCYQSTFPDMQVSTGFSQSLVHTTVFLVDEIPYFDSFLVDETSILTIVFS